MRLYMILMRFQTTMTDHQRLTIQQILLQTQRMVLNLENPQKRSLDLRTAKPETQKMLFQQTLRAKPTMKREL